MFVSLRGRFSVGATGLAVFLFCCFFCVPFNTVSAAAPELAVLIKWENVNSLLHLSHEQQQLAVESVSTLLRERLASVNVSQTLFRPNIGLTPHGKMNTLATLKVEHLHGSFGVQGEDGQQQQTDLTGSIRRLLGTTTTTSSINLSKLSSQAIKIIREANGDESLRSRISRSLETTTTSSYEQVTTSTQRKLQGYAGRNRLPTIVDILVEEEMRFDVALPKPRAKKSQARPSPPPPPSPPVPAPLRRPNANKVFRPRFYHNGTSLRESGFNIEAVWHLNRINQASLPLDEDYLLPVIHRSAPASWVYVIDTGILTTHVELSGRVETIFDNNPEEPTACHSHGTHVAGSIGGTTVGVNPTARIFNVKTLNCEGWTYTSGLIQAVSAIIQHCTSHGGRSARGIVINMSLGGPSDPNAAGNAPFASVLAQAREECDAVIVAAAGNRGESTCMTVPAGYQANNQGGLIAVGATTISDTFASFSNLGPCVGVNAPGVNIVSSVISSTTAYGYMSGTSMASPMVAGVASLHMAQRPSTWDLNHPTARFADNIKAKILRDAVLKTRSLPDLQTTSRLLQITNVAITTDQSLSPVAPAVTPPGQATSGANSLHMRPSSVVAVLLLLLYFVVVGFTASLGVHEAYSKECEVNPDFAFCSFFSSSS